MVALTSTKAGRDLLRKSVIVVDLYAKLLGIFKAVNRLKTVSPRVLTVMKRIITFEMISNNLDDRTFRHVFRMTKGQFEQLHDKVAHLLSRNVEMGERSHRTTISSGMRLAITLRMLAGASYGDIILSFHVGRSTTYQIFHDTRKALSKVLKLPGLPKTEEELEELAHGFKHSRKRMNPLTGCVGALGGIAVRMKKPSCPTAAAFYGRKGYYCLPVQALVDSQYRFLDVSIRCVGSTHDQLAHAVSRLGQYLAASNLPNEYWIVGDEAYLVTNSLICPIPISQVKSIEEDAFNVFLSSLRIHVEQAFGMLSARWRSLDYLEISVDVNAEIVALCMKLHNFCIDSKPSNIKDITEDEACERNDDVRAWYACCKSRHANWILDDEQTEDKDAFMMTKRDAMVEMIRRKGLSRPLPLGAPCRAALL